MKKITITTTGQLGEFLRERRKGMSPDEKGSFTIDRVSAEAGMTPATLMNIEKAKGSVRSELLLALCTVLKINVELSHE